MIPTPEEAWADLPEQIRAALRTLAPEFAAAMDFAREAANEAAVGSVGAADSAGGSPVQGQGAQTCRCGPEICYLHKHS